MQEIKNKYENIFSPMPLPDINGRVKKLVDTYAKGSVKKFSEIIQLSSSQKLNRVFNLDKRNGEYPDVSSDIIISIANKISDVNIDWLLTGRGSMLKDEGVALKGGQEPVSPVSESSVYYTMYKEERAKAESQAEQIGALKQTIRQLEEKIEGLQASGIDLDSEGARDAGIADVG